MDIPEELGELLKDLPKALDKLRSKVELEDKAREMAKKSVHQLESLLPDLGQLKDGKEPFADLDKLMSGNDDIILYGKALILSQEILQDLVDKAGALPQNRLKKFNPKWRKQAERKIEMLTMAVTYLTMMRIKRDIMERYEIDDKPKVPKKEAK